MNTATMMIRESIKKYGEKYDQGFNKIQDTILEQREQVDSKFQLSQNKISEFQNLIDTINPNELKRSQDAALTYMKDKLNEMKEVLALSLETTEKKNQKLFTEFNQTQEEKEKAKEIEMKFTLADLERQAQSYTQNQIAKSLHQSRALSSNSRTAGNSQRGTPHRTGTTGARKGQKQRYGNNAASKTGPLSAATHSSANSAEKEKQSERGSRLASQRKSGNETKAYHQPYKRLATQNQTDFQDDGGSNHSKEKLQMNTV